MNSAVLTLLLSQVIAPLLTGFVMSARLADPAGTDAAIAALAEGDVKHFLRGKFSFFVDILWSFPAFTSELSTLVDAAVSQNTLPADITSLLTPAAPVAAPPAITPPVITPPAAPVQAEGTLTLNAPLTETPAGTFTQA